MNKKILIKLMNVLMLAIILGGVLPTNLFTSEIQEKITTEKINDKENETLPINEEHIMVDNEKEDSKYFVNTDVDSVDNPLVNQQKAIEINHITKEEIEIPLENKEVESSSKVNNIIIETSNFEIISKKEIDTVFTEKHDSQSIKDNKINDEILSNDEVLKMLGIKVNTKFALKSLPGYIDSEKLITISEDERSNLSYARQLSNVERDQVVNLRIDDPSTNKRTIIPIKFRLKGVRTLKEGYILMRGWPKKWHHVQKLTAPNDMTPLKQKWLGQDIGGERWGSDNGLDNPSSDSEVYGNYAKEKDKFMNTSRHGNGGDSLSNVYNKTKKHISADTAPVGRHHRSFGFWTEKDKFFLDASGYRKLGFTNNNKSGLDMGGKMYFVADPKDPSVEYTLEVGNRYQWTDTPEQLNFGLVGKVTYDLDGGTMNDYISKKDLVWGQYLPGTKNYPDFKPTKVNAKFLGWSKEKNGDILPDSYTSQAGTEKYFAIYDNEIDIPDPTLKKQLLQTLGKSLNSEILESEARSLTKFSYDGRNKDKIKNLEGLQYFENLDELKIIRNELSNLSPISKLTNLTNLYLGDNHITNVDPLKDLINLTSLRVDYNEISDLNSLSKLVNLTTLALNDTPTINDISIIKNFTKLERLWVENTNISSLEPLRELKNLKDLNAQDCKIFDLSPLKSLSNLKEINVKNQIIPGGKLIAYGSDVEVLNKVIGVNGNKVVPISNDDYEYNEETGKIKYKNVTGVEVKSYAFKVQDFFGETNVEATFSGKVSHDVELSGGINIPDPILRKRLLLALGKSNNYGISPEEAKTLEKFEYQATNLTKIKSLEGLEHFTNLKQLYLTDNDIEDVTPVANLSNLIFFSIDGNPLTTLDPLIKLTKVKDLNINNTKIKSLNGLNNLTKLEYLSLTYNNAIDDISIVKNFKNLVSFRAIHTSISSLEPLSGLDNLLHIYVSNCKIKDLTPLKLLTNLRTVDVKDQAISGQKLIAYGPEAEILNITKGVDGNKIPPISSSDYSYNETTGKVKFKKIISSGLRTYSFKIQNDIGKVRTTFSGKVTHDVELNDGINIPDSTLKRKLLQALGKPENYGISPEEAKTLKYFEYNAENWSKIKNIEGLQHFSNLEVLKLDYNDVVDITPLEGLFNLKELSLQENPVVNANSLKNLINLKILWLNNTKVTDLDFLSRLTNIKELNLKNSTNTHDITAIKNLINLESLKIDYSDVNDITPLSSLTKLKELSLKDNPITSVDALKDLVNLESLGLGSTKVSDLSSLSKLINLKEFLVDHSTNVTDISIVRNFIKLEKLWFNNTNVSSIKALSNLTKLTSLNARNCRISDISQLKNLVNLKDANLSNQSIIGEKLIAYGPEAEILNMIIDIRGNKITPFDSINYDYNMTTEKVRFKNITSSGLKSYSFAQQNDIGKISTMYSGKVTHDVELNAGINIPDPSLKRALLKALGKPLNYGISPEESKTLKVFNYDGDRGPKIKSLLGLEHFTNLRTLNLVRNEVLDISALAPLIELTSLELGANPINNVEALTNLTKLKILSLDYTKIENINNLSKLVNLVQLDLNNTKIMDIVTLSSFVNLEKLWINDTKISSLDPLAELINLKVLRIQNCQIFDLTPLKSLIGLTDINVANQKISAEKLIAYGPEVGTLNITKDVNGNKVVPTISPDYDYNQETGKINFKNITSPIKKSYSFIIENDIGTENVIFNGTITHEIEISEGLNIPDPILKKELLKSLGKSEKYAISPEDAKTLEVFSYNGEGLSKIENLDGLENFINLKKLYVPHNNIRNLEPISNLNLTHIQMNFNKIQDISQLSDSNFDDLKYLSMAYNEIRDISSLDRFSSGVISNLEEQKITLELKEILTSTDERDVAINFGKYAHQYVANDDLEILENKYKIKNINTSSEKIIRFESVIEGASYSFNGRVVMPYKVMRTFNFDTKEGNWAGKTNHVLEVGTKFDELTLTTPKKEGHKFLGWQYDDGTDVIDYDLNIGVPSFDANFLAKWDPIVN